MIVIKKVKSSIVFLLALVLMLTACSNKEMPEGNENDVDILGENNIGEKDNEIYSDADLDGEYTDDEIIEQISRTFYGKVKSIVGNEIEIEIGTVPEETWNEEIPPEEKKKSHVPMVQIEERENPPGMEDIIAPNPPEYGGSIFGENGEINLTYTGESRTLIIPAGTDIRNRLGKKETLDSIKKGTVLMVKPKVIDGKEAGIEVVRILG